MRVLRVFYAWLPRVTHYLRSIRFHFMWIRSDRCANYLGRARSALRIVGKGEDVARSVSTLPARMAADCEFLLFASDEMILSRVRDASLRDDRLRDQIDPRREGGVLLACGNFSCFYYGLIKEAEFLDGALLVVGEVTEQNSALVKRVEKICGIRLDLAQIDRAGFMRAARHLRSGGVLATMMDTYAASPDAGFTTMLGKAVLYDHAFFELAVKYKAMVVPACVTTESWRFKGHVGQSLDAASLGVDALAGKVLGFFEQMALRHSEQWMSWSNFYGRLRHGSE